MKVDVAKLDKEHEILLRERADSEYDFREISDYILPGRGIYQTISKPKKKRFSAPKAINTSATEALEVLTAGMQSGLTSQSRKWFILEWENEQAKEVPFLQQWLQQAEDEIYTVYAGSNFYSAIQSFYTESAGFGNGFIYQLEDTRSTVRFELSTVGEYVVSLNGTGRVDKCYRTLFMTPRMLEEKFSLGRLPDPIKQLIRDKDNEAYFFPVVHAIIPEEHLGKPFASVYYLKGGPNSRTQGLPAVLQSRGYYEFPGASLRWDVIGSDSYGIGPGHRALNNTKRLQEMEKSFLMAVHKSVDPPVNAPARMRDQLDLLPGGKNYYSSPNDLVKEVYQGRVDLSAAAAAIERVERQIGRQFYNDVFLTASRDPNASPLRTGEVEARNDEKFVRLGPVVQRFQTDVFEPLIERTFNIILRQERLPEIPPEFLPYVEGFKVRMISPLAQAQKMMEARSIESFLQFVGAVSQFDQNARDNIDIDGAVREYHDISGAPIEILRPVEQVGQLRQQRAEAMQAQMQREQQMQEATVTSKLDAEQAQAAKAQSEAAANLVNSPVLVQ